MPQITGTVSTSGDNTIVAAPAALEQIFITGYSLFAASAVNAYWHDGASPIIQFSPPFAVSLFSANPNIWGDLVSTLSYGATVPATTESAYQTGIACSLGKALLLNLSAAVSVTYTLDYIIK